MVEPFNLLQQAPVPARGRRVNLAPHTYNEVYYRKFREKLLEERRQWRKENKDTIKARNKANYEKNKTAINTRQKLYYRANKKKIMARNSKNCAAWRDRNREQLNEKARIRGRRPEVRARQIVTHRKYRERQRALKPKQYVDIAVCPATGKTFEQLRFIGTAGKTVKTHCKICDSHHNLIAGKFKEQRK